MCIYIYIYICVNIYTHRERCIDRSTFHIASLAFETRVQPFCRPTAQQLTAFGSDFPGGDAPLYTINLYTIMCYTIM